MIIPKLLLLVPLLLLVEAQNDPQGEFKLSARLPLRRPVITPGFRSEATIASVPNTPMTTKQVPEVVTQQYTPTVKEEVITMNPEIAKVPVSTEQGSETEKPEFTFIYSEDHSENFTSFSSESSVYPVPRQPIQRPPWPRPANIPIENPPSRIDPPTTISGLSSYTTPRYISPSSATDTQVTSENPDVTERIALEPEVQKPGFTIILADNYTTAPLPVDYSNPPISSATRQPIRRPYQPTNIPRSSPINLNTVTPRLPSEKAVTLTISQPDKPSYTIIIVKNEDSKLKPDGSLPDVTTLNPTNIPIDTTKVDTTTKLPTTSQQTTYKPNYVPTTASSKQPSTPIWRFPDPSSSIAPPPTSISTTTWRPTTVVQTRPTPPQTPTTRSTTTWRPTTVVQTRPTPPQTPTTRSTTTWRPTTVAQTRPTPPETPTTRSTTTWRPTTVAQTRFTPPQTPTSTSTTTWKPPTTFIPPTYIPPQTPTSTSTTTWKPPTSVVQIRPTPPQTNIINQLHDYNCRNVNGYYSVTNKCDEYIFCKNSIAYQIICPDGLHFDPAAKWPAFPCAYPSEVKCLNQSIKQQPQPTNECPHRYGYFPVPNGDCGHFIMCQEGLATVMPCPPGLAFNVITSTCDWPVNVPGCNPSVFQSFECPASKVDKFGISEIINYRYKNSCKNYIACHEGRPRFLSCDSGYSFDEQTAKCVESSLIRNCEN